MWRGANRGSRVRAGWAGSAGAVRSGVLALQVQQYQAARRVARSAPRVRRTTITVSA
jgi:hypothetical protein